ncbi:hypothetical protein CEUSTIGMA_g2968.t1 [Chlamydomonas eustigma]|uniref:ATP-dependent RNA helicase n=1 Tax=Chlamydomonas eustigma TaxID=1157962 RepID=A0A250WXL7_9CHLO|nr:hypothetical protein CEUSTIGMA_g2968.t1 [Chlamydomonas eustigma]|eukprot:GAX75525.1 hypothetical protein CEUSTIGMA_g2968.t1 [Chlamydomonas eustigma]
MSAKPHEDGALSSKSSRSKTPVLPWMRVPIAIKPGSGLGVEELPGLEPCLAAALRNRLGFVELFAVQTAVWKETGGGLSTAHDMCIAAPTGSGKTLAYVLPVLNRLSRQSTSGMSNLQALVVLPTRDLACQVHSVFQALCPAVHLTLGLAAAQKTLAAEACLIMNPQMSGSAKLSSCIGPSFSSPMALLGPGITTDPVLQSCWSTLPGPSAIHSHTCVDVLVATPGRLVAHMQKTPGFTLRHLKFLVIDETDRLLKQSYQEWLPQVIDHLSAEHSSTAAGNDALSPRAGQEREPNLNQIMCDLPYSTSRVVKLVVSATLTRDPSKLQRLDLRNPRYIAASAADHRYHVPRSLQEFKVLCSDAGSKPQTLLALLKQLKGESTVVFASSVEMTHKVFLLLKASLEKPEEVAEFSSLMQVKQRAQSLLRFKAGHANVLVASDAMTRGMDVNVIKNVVNYDAPVYVKTYVHRAGRAARAGRAGRVFTLLRTEDVRHFKQMLHKADNTFVRDYRISREILESCSGSLRKAILQVQELLSEEAIHKNT